MNRRTRVGWLPGSDRLRGRCHCGAQTEADDPVLMWEWLSAHPVHPSADAGRPESRIPAPAPAHRVTDPALIRRRPTVPA
ncbi:hypothetical protein [Virgisporangium aurantiacum]|uniref:Uncharacterized protein n=1 Tax=Virgisporangium aurantiacum TaxID=175570 RepID=A0A8J4E0N9_9ACTN|nr:hypothetical protein [Virgisporangium aurantiacum]GIJ57159.1 hypothetical protein Vau01_046750 [Virgisporangium aurantiacum]